MSTSTSAGGSAEDPFNFSDEDRNLRSPTASSYDREKVRYLQYFVQKLLVAIVILYYADFLIMGLSIEFGYFSYINRPSPN